MMIYIIHICISKANSAYKLLVWRQYQAVPRIFCVKKLEGGSSAIPDPVNHTEPNYDTGWFRLYFFVSYHIISYHTCFVISHFTCRLEATTETKNSHGL